LQNTKVHTSVTEGEASTQVEGCSDQQKSDSRRVADCGATPCSVSSSLEFETEWEIEARIREEYNGCLIGRFESEYHQPIFRSKYPTVKAVKEDTSRQNQMTNPDKAPLPNEEHLPSTPNEPHTLEVSEKPRKNRVNSYQWNKVIHVIRKLLRKKEKNPQQRQGQKGGEVSGVERHGQFVQHDNVAGSEISLPNDERVHHYQRGRASITGLGLW
jgi:hypothetical protein